MTHVTAISQIGNGQLESVLLLFGRLGEDVSGFDQSLHNKRKQELIYSLHQYMPDLFNLMISTVQQQITLRSPNSSLTLTALNTLCVYLELAELSCIFLQDGIILKLLTQLLTVKTHRVLAADCLLTIVQRKGKVIEQIPVLLLFKEEILDVFFKASSGSSSASLEDNYLFVKKLCKVMATLGTAQLCVLWGNPREPGIERPDNFLNYLQAMLKFLQHPSQNLNLCSAQLWLAFLKHEHISKDEQFQYLLPDVVTEAAAKLMRVGDLSWDTSAVGDYARMDFEETEEFASFFGKLRHTLMAVIRLATLIIPAVVHDLAITQLLHLLMGETKGTELLKNHSDEQPSPFVLAWEQLSCFLDSVIPTLFKSDSQPESAMCQSACRCIEQLLSSFSDVRIYKFLTIQ
jgi:exportin-5